MGLLTTDDWKATARWLLQKDVDEGISHVLELFGNRHEADRAWLFRYNQEFTHLWNTHEWVASGVEPCADELQGIPVEVGAFMHESHFKRGRFIMEDVDLLPRRAQGLQVELKRQGIRSIVSFPVFREEKIAFQIGYDAVDSLRVWSEAEQGELKDVAGMIANSLWYRGKVAPDPYPPFHPETRLVHLRVGAGSMAIPLLDIVWIEAAGDYTIVHSKGGRRTTDRRRLIEWEGLLPRAEFCRIHRRIIVRVKSISRFDREAGRWRLSLYGVEEPFAVGRAFRPVVRKQLGF